MEVARRKGQYNGYIRWGVLENVNLFLNNSVFTPDLTFYCKKVDKIKDGLWEFLWLRVPPYPVNHGDSQRVIKETIL
jgi:hypothetical protein